MGLKIQPLSDRVVVTPQAAETKTASGNIAKYILDIKQGRDVIGTVIYDNKAERTIGLANLQNLLSRL